MIDAHQHFWRIGRNGCAWPTPDLAAIHRDFGPADLAAEAGALGVTGSVLVQSQPSDRDTDWLLDLAEAEPFVKAVVGWADLAAPDAGLRIAALAQRPKLKGLRPMLQALVQDDWILGEGVAAGLRAMAEQGLVFDALIEPRHLPHLRVLAERHPDLAIVIDHAAKPAIATGGLDPWRAEIAALVEAPGVTCKLSGLLTEAAPGQGWDDLAPYVEHLLAVFGPDRLMWGSDWPVIELASTYRAWFDLARAGVARAGSGAIGAVFESTATRVYRLSPAAWPSQRRTEP